MHSCKISIMTEEPEGSVVAPIFNGVFLQNPLAREPDWNLFEARAPFKILPLGVTTTKISFYLQDLGN